MLYWNFSWVLAIELFSPTLYPPLLLFYKAIERIRAEILASLLKYGICNIYAWGSDMPFACYSDINN